MGSMKSWMERLAALKILANRQRGYLERERDLKQVILGTQDEIDASIASLSAQVELLQVGQQATVAARTRAAE